MLKVLDGPAVTQNRLPMVAVFLFQRLFRCFVVGMPSACGIFRFCCGENERGCEKKDVDRNCWTIVDAIKQKGLNALGIDISEVKYEEQPLVYVTKSGDC